MSYTLSYTIIQQSPGVSCHDTSSRVMVLSSTEGMDCWDLQSTDMAVENISVPNEIVFAIVHLYIHL